MSWGCAVSEFRRYVRNAILLVGSSLLMRSVSLAFEAYVSQKVGAEGMGLFSLIMSVYGFAVTFATSGVSLAVTRLCAEALGRGETGDVRAIVRRATLYAVGFGGTASLFLFTFARPIGLSWLGDARTVPSLRVLAFALVPIALSAVYSGYFQAVRRVSRNAATQLFEQGLRIFLTTYGLMALAPSGLEYACLALVGGSALAELSSFFFIFLQYLFDRKKHFSDTRPPTNRGIWRRLFGTTLPLATSAYMRSGLLMVEHILIPISLAASGLGRGDALASYGVLHSMALPLILYPAAIPTAFAGLLVPEMAESAVRGERKRIRYMTERALSATLVFSVACAGLLIASSSELGRLLYANAEAGRFIRLLAPTVVLMYLDSVTDAILKGLGFQVYSMWVNIADAVLSILLVLLLLPRFGAVGYVLVIALAELFNFTLSILRLLRAVPFRISLFRFLLLPLVSAIGATAVVGILLPTAGTAASLVLHLVLGALLFLVFLRIFGTVRDEDVHYLMTLLPDKKRGERGLFPPRKKKQGIEKKSENGL